MLAAAVMACISACAVTSSSVSVRLCPRPMISPLATITQPMGTSPCASAKWASANAMRMKRSSSRGVVVFIMG